MNATGASLISATNTSSLVFYPNGNSPFTIEFWAYITDTSKDNQTLFATGPTSNNFAIMYNFYRTSPSTNLRSKLAIVTATGTTPTACTVRIGTPNVPINQWCHICVQRRSLDDAQVFFNGALVAYGGINWDMNRGNYFTFGRRYGGSPDFSSGLNTNLTGLRISSVARITNLPATLAVSDINTQYFIPSTGRVTSANMANPPSTDDYMVTYNADSSAAIYDLIGTSFDWIASGGVSWSSSVPT
jgi:hypothetical protein